MDEGQNGRHDAISWRKQSELTLTMIKASTINSDDETDIKVKGVTGRLLKSWN